VQDCSLFVSFITELELLGVKGLNADERKSIKFFLDSCNIIDVNRQIKDQVIFIRENLSIKLPDAIIAATAIYLDLPLVTADKDFAKISSITVFRVTP
jgi:predicted nucleic acid-binding protein